MKQDLTFIFTQKASNCWNLFTHKNFHSLNLLFSFSSFLKLCEQHFYAFKGCLASVTTAMALGLQVQAP